MQRADSLEKTLMLGKIEGRRRRGRQRMRWLNGITDSMDMGLVDSGSWWWTGRPGVLQFMGSQRVGYDWATELIIITRPQQSYYGKGTQALESDHLCLYPGSIKYYCMCLVPSVVSNSLRSHGLLETPARLLCQWDSPGQNTGVGCHFLLQTKYYQHWANCLTPYDFSFLYCKMEIIVSATS